MTLYQINSIQHILYFKNLVKCCLLNFIATIVLFLFFLCIWMHVKIIIYKLFNCWIDDIYLLNWWNLIKRKL